MDRPVFTSIQPPGVAHADAVSADETLEFKPMAAATKDADKTTAGSRELRLTGGIEWLETR